MAEATQFTIGADVSCSDGACGELSRVVVDPVAETVTHLVVDPKHKQVPGRLVPLELVEAAATGEIRLSCTLAEFEKLQAAEETQFLPGLDNYWLGYGPGQVYLHPYFSMGGFGLGSVAALGPDFDTHAQAVLTDMVPLGEVAVHRHEPVHASDGDIGKVEGLVIEPASHHVTHVLLQEGHLWGRKQVAIPISAVAGVEDGVRLKISKQQVEDLPEVDIDHPTG